LGLVRGDHPKADRNQMPWSTGILEYWLWRNEIYILINDDIDQRLKLEHYPLLIPNIPFFRHPIGYLMANTTSLA